MCQKTKMTITYITYSYTHHHTSINIQQQQKYAFSVSTTSQTDTSPYYLNLHHYVLKTEHNVSQTHKITYHSKTIRKQQARHINIY